jgi:hypothetical protein
MAFRRNQSMSTTGFWWADTDKVVSLTHSVELIRYVLSQARRSNP